jgi:hypothetical protein
MPPKNNQISIDGRCGKLNGNTQCPVGQCCDKYGWCGIKPHCTTICDPICRSTIYGNKFRI